MASRIRVGTHCALILALPNSQDKWGYTNLLRGQFMQSKTSRRRLLLAVAGFSPTLSRLTIAQNAAAPAATASVLNMHLDWMEHDFLPAAEAMPEDKFFWAPRNGEFKGVRTFAEQILHVGQVNFILAAAILEEKPPAESDWAHNPESLKSRSMVLNYLRDSFRYTRKALSSITEQNARTPIKHPIMDITTTRLGLGIVTVAHPFNHYGQMVEYLRMNNVMPPASR